MFERIVVGVSQVDSATRAAQAALALAEISERGPVTIGELDVHRQAPRQSESWWGWGDGKRVVEHLFYTG